MKCKKTGKKHIKKLNPLDALLIYWYYIRFLNNKYYNPFIKDEVNQYLPEDKYIEGN